MSTPNIPNTPGPELGPRRRSSDPRIDRLVKDVKQLRAEVQELRGDLQHHLKDGQARSQDLADKVETVGTQVGEIMIHGEEHEKDHQRHAADHVKLESEVKELDKQIRGNGEPGLKVQVANLVQSVASINYWQRLTFGAVIIALVGALLDLIKK